MGKTERVAVLDDRGVLIDCREVPADEVGADDTLAGDLPADGTYCLVDGAFIPITHGKGKAHAPAVSRDRALRLLIDAVDQGNPIPQECRDWAAWFDTFGGR